MLAFLTRAMKSYRTTGAVFPSGRPLATALTRAIRTHRGPKRILEVGPGTGAISREILKALHDGDCFCLVEINPDFASHLEQNVLAPFRKENPGIEVTLYTAPIEETDLTEQFDYIVCGLPFNNFPLWQVSLIFRTMLSLLKDGGELTYFGYVGMKAMKWPWVGPRGRDRLRRRIAMERALERRYHGRRSIVVRNIMPAHAVRLKT